MQGAGTQKITYFRINDCTKRGAFFLLPCLRERRAIIRLIVNLTFRLSFLFASPSQAFLSPRCRKSSPSSSLASVSTTWWVSYRNDCCGGMPLNMYPSKGVCSIAHASLSFVLRTHLSHSCFVVNTSLPNNGVYIDLYSLYIAVFR